VKRKAEAKNNSPDLQEPTFNLLVAAKGEARGRAVIFVLFVVYSLFEKTKPIYSFSV